MNSHFLSDLQLFLGCFCTDWNIRQCKAWFLNDFRSDRLFKLDFLAEL